MTFQVSSVAIVANYLCPLHSLCKNSVNPKLAFVANALAWILGSHFALLRLPEDDEGGRGGFFALAGCGFYRTHRLRPAVVTLGLDPRVHA